MSVKTILVLMAFLVLASSAFAWGQQSINSDYYFNGIYSSPSNGLGAWDYYSYNTANPYPTMGGGLYFPPSGYSYSYPGAQLGYNNYYPNYYGGYGGYGVPVHVSSDYYSRPYYSSYPVYNYPQPVYVEQPQPFFGICLTIYC